MPDYPERPDIRHYPIGEFAKKAGVSTHFLKFYEEKGILHPMVQDNGYRYYNIQDASLVLECRRLKNMGFSVREIERGINDCTPQEEQDALVRQEKAQLEELHRQQMHLWGLAKPEGCPQVLRGGRVERAPGAGHLVPAPHAEQGIYSGGCDLRSAA